MVYHTFEKLQYAWKMYWDKHSPRNMQRMLKEGRVLNHHVSSMLLPSLSDWDDPFYLAMSLPSISDGYDPFYLVMSAIRGPDVHTIPALKPTFTARLRGILFSKYNCRWGLRNTAPLTKEELDVFTDSKHFAYLQDPRYMLHFEAFSHWCLHMRTAIALTAGHPVWNGLEADAQATLIKLTTYVRTYAFEASNQLSLEQYNETETGGK